MLKIKKFFKRGNGELLGFTLILPVFVTLLYLIVGIAQIALGKEKLEYVTYSAARAAVVSETYNDALANATEVAKESLVNTSYDKNSVQVQIVNDGSQWVKGNYITVKVSFKVETMVDDMLGVSGGTNQTSQIVVMLERPATNNT